MLYAKSQLPLNILADRFRQMAASFREYSDANDVDINFSCSTIRKEKHVNMTDPKDGPTVRTETCRTVACHGGVAFLVLSKEDDAHASYLDGANLLAEFLGFDSSLELQDWAAENPDIWGCDSGACMFNVDGWRAFDCDPRLGCKVTLNKIADWYDAVGDRVDDNANSTMISNVITILFVLAVAMTIWFIYDYNKVTRCDIGNPWLYEKCHNYLD